MGGGGGGGVKLCQTQPGLKLDLLWSDSLRKLSGSMHVLVWAISHLNMRICFSSANAMIDVNPLRVVETKHRQYRMV